MASLARNESKRRKSVTRHFDDSGRAYYHDEESNATSWEVPEGSDVIEPKDQNTTIDSLSSQVKRIQLTRGAGWETCLDNTTGNYYYWHKQSGVTQWDIPAELVEARKAQRRAAAEKATAQGAAATASAGAAAGGAKKKRNSKMLWKRASFVALAGVKMKKATTRSRRRVVASESTDVNSYVKRTINKPPAVRDLIKNAMGTNFVFAQLTNRVVEDMVDAMAPFEAQEGFEIIRQGEKGDFFYVIQVGACDVIIDGKKVATLEQGKSFGELALFYNCPRNASILAAQDCLLWRIGRLAFRGLLMQGATQNSTVAMSALKQISWLRNLSEEELGIVASACTAEDFAEGDTIIKKGDHGDKFYIISTGMVKCIVDAHRPPLFLGPKKFFGELALLHDQPRAADVVAARRTEVLSLTRHAFHVLLGSVHDQLVVSYDGQEGKAPSPSKARIAVVAESKAAPAADRVMNENNIQLHELEQIQVLGEGTFGRVQLVRHARTSSKWALKIMQKAQVQSSGQTKAVMLEKEVMCRLSHPLVLRLEATYQSNDLLYMLLEVIPGGELFQLLADSETGVVPVSQARFYTACVVDAFSYMHGLKIVYRDLKPENLLIAANGYLKVIDFGFAKFLDKAPYKTFTFCGTPEYFAPEMMKGQGYSQSVDTWGIGILLYEMLYGYTPFADFENGDPRTTMKYIIQNKVSFPGDVPHDPQAKDFILGLLQKSVVDRMGTGAAGVKEAKKHSFFSSFDWAAFNRQNLRAPWIPEMGSEGVVDTTEEYMTFEEYQRSVPAYAGDQAWCAKW